MVEKVLEKRHCRIVSRDKMLFAFMPERGTIDAMIILRRTQEEYHGKGKNLHMCFVDLGKAFDKLARKVSKWANRNKGMPEVLVRSVMSLYGGAKTRVREDHELSEELEVKVGLHQGSVPFLLQWW